MSVVSLPRFRRRHGASGRLMVPGAHRARAACTST
jgi:hypothetical protein